MNEDDKAMAKELKCGRFYKLKVRSKKTGKWEFRLFGCSLRSMKSAMKFYKDRFKKQTKIVLVK